MLLRPGTAGRYGGKARMSHIVKGVMATQGEPSKVTWRPVAVQHLDDDGARITGAIKQGDQIVALGAHLLREGEPVRVAAQTLASAAERVGP